ncbi:unnamed protein product [Nezara viridula]|uniref:Uncharacterized protein n=1 Tax=Nezara viridula TaxID=85310 RepID=A0A9P0MX34_NEZVI|nr:unnamed protein product [Nezara viridula]
MLSLLTVLVSATAISASVVQQRPERKIADANFLKQQKQVLDLFVGVGHSDHWKMECANFDMMANLGSFTDEKYPKEFMRSFAKGMLPKGSIFTMSCYRSRSDTIRLFDVFYFAKDFDTFYKSACWAKQHLNGGMFTYAYMLALIHRSDCQDFVLPPQYEMFPNFFVPIDTLHEVYDAKMEGLKEGRFTYNNTGYEYIYHDSMYGGLLYSEERGHSDIKVAYFREDVGLNSYLSDMTFRNPQWMCKDKYNSPWMMKRRGENYYHMLQQLLARYLHERNANSLPNLDPLIWEKPIMVGYNPRVAFFNGRPMHTRPDGMIPTEFAYRWVARAKTFERRIMDAVDAGAIWETSNKTLLSLNNEDGMDLIGRMVFGTVDSPSKDYFQSAYYAAIEALTYVSSGAGDREFVGNALALPITAARDPVYFNYLARMVVRYFQRYAKLHAPYSHAELGFNGVSVQNIEVDKMVTYFDMFDYEVTNAVPMQKSSDYTDHRYIARQYRLNHKPYNYKVTVNSEQAGEGIVRVFLGQKYDSEDRVLSVEQARLGFFEIDRFLVKLAPGVNVIERSSKESPFFVSDRDGFRTLYTNINNAINQKAPFYISQYGRCGLPERLQLPMGWKQGRPIQMAVIVNSFDRSSAQPDNNFDIACGGMGLYDGRPMGFPFNRRLYNNYHVPNFFFKDVVIEHKGRDEVNRPSAS